MQSFLNLLGHKMYKSWISVTIPDNSKLKRNSLGAMMLWCDTNAGKELEEWSWTYCELKESSNYAFLFHFKNKNDAILFKLIWA
jgi:hypothetical protein